MKIVALIFASQLFLGQIAFAQVRGVPSLPSRGTVGLQGSVGAGFADFSIKDPQDDLRVDRGIFAAAAIERGFNVLNLYLTLTLSNLNAEGLANYSYRNLSSATTYTATDIKFTANILDLGLGLKMKLIDKYWFRPYIEGGGLGGYHTINYSSKMDTLAAQGSDYKSKDVVMGSGVYGEAGLEAMFAQSFGVKLAARQSTYQTKKLETLQDRTLRFVVETYYFSLLFGM